MPDLSTTLHTDMLRGSKRKHSLSRRLIRAIRGSFEPWTYGTEWGVIEDVPPLKRTLDHWLLPYVQADKVAVEIGPGGGRWTRHLLGFSKLYAVEYYEPLLAEIRRNFSGHKNVIFIKNNGSDFPAIPENSVDFCFSFGVFVHLDFPIVEGYLENLKNIMKPGADIVIQYADKNKIMAKENKGFAENTPERMRAAVLAHGYEVREEDTTSLWHSSLIRFARPPRD